MPAQFQSHLDAANFLLYLVGMTTSDTNRERPEHWVRQYPWTPGHDNDKTRTIPQSFAAIRSGVLPAIQVDAEGEAYFVFIDVFTKVGARSYEANIARAIHAEPTKPTKKGK